MTFGSIIGLLLTGLLVGVVARIVTPGRQRLGLSFTVLLGVLGTLGGSLLLQATAPSAGVVVEFVVSVAVAAVLVLAVTTGRRGPRNIRH